MIGTPSDVGPQRHNRAVMGAAGVPRSKPFKCQAFDLHNPRNALGVHLGPAGGPKLPVEERPDPPVAIGRALIDDCADQRQKHRIPALAVSSARRCHTSAPVDQIGARHAQRLCDRLHREPSLRRF